MSKSLKHLDKGVRAQVLDVLHGHPLSERLVELGFVVGESVEIAHEAPLSRDPIVVICSGTRIALRRSEADLILVDDSHHVPELIQIDERPGLKGTAQ